jgi:serine-type D-Ala-D-Ala carboxypeptidase/endopeptidase (penicillin-binding protein 4)
MVLCSAVIHPQIQVDERKTSLLETRMRMLVMVVWVLCTSWVHAGPLPAPLARAAKEHGLRTEELGLYIHVAGEKLPRLAYNAKRAMNPASAMKLVTTAAGLHLLGPTHSWRTQVYADGPVKDAVLEGNLVIKGAGDPKLTLEEFWTLLRQIRTRGIKNIHGELVLDRSAFEKAQGAPGDFDGDALRPYNALPDALLLNFNAVRLNFIPKPESGLVDILMSPLLPQVTLRNELHAVQAECNDWPQDPAQDSHSNELWFKGDFPIACGETARNYSPLSSSLYIEAVFRELWKELGGTLSGQVSEGTASPTATFVAAHDSEPLAEVIRDINKFSNNVMARHLYLALGLAEDVPPLNTEKSAQAIKNWLQREGFDFPELVVENGSGLSRVERISPEHLGKLLLWAAKSPLAPEFIASMPLSALDGTMRKRLKESPTAGRAHIKTGYLEGVRASVGYVQDEEDKLVVVVCVVNGSSARSSGAFHDAVIEWAHAKPAKKKCCKR